MTDHPADRSADPSTAAGTDSTGSGTDAAKDGVRRRLRARRRTRTRADQVAEAVAAQALAVPAVHALVAAGTGSVALYVSRPGEPGTGRLRAALREAGVRVLLPVVRPGSRLEWIEDDGEVAPGITPEDAPDGGLGTAAFARVDVALVPALAVDTSGRRLGQGGGYYDRAMAGGRPGLVLAVVHDDEVLAEPLPTGEYDLPVDGALTPSRLVMFPTT